MVKRNRGMEVGRLFGGDVFDANTHQLIGAGIVGTSAGELLAKAVMGIETKADALSLSSAIHAHPTLSEAIALVSAMKEGTITALFIYKKAAVA